METFYKQHETNKRCLEIHIQSPLQLHTDTGNHMQPFERKGIKDVWWRSGLTTSIYHMIHSSALLRLSLKQSNCIIFLVLARMIMWKLLCHCTRQSHACRARNRNSTDLPDVTSCFVCPVSHLQGMALLPDQRSKTSPYRNGFSCPHT